MEWISNKNDCICDGAQANMFFPRQTSRQLQIRYNRASRCHIPAPAPAPVKDSRCRDNLSPTGLLLRKTPEEGDDKLRVEPNRDYSGLFLYKKYDTYGDVSFLSNCECRSYGYLCEHCETLNTSVFHDMLVPLNPTDWEELKDYLLNKRKWTEKSLYDWVLFWMKEHASRHNYGRGLVFFDWAKFIHMNNNIHLFFHYIFQFIMKRNLDIPHVEGSQRFAHPLGMNGEVVRKNLRKYKHFKGRLKKNHMSVVSCHATIRLSCEVYGKGGRITDIKTYHVRNSIIQYTFDQDPRRDQFVFSQKAREMAARRRWKNVFQYVIDEMNHEVRFRPGMAGMIDCSHSFSQYTLQLHS